MEHTDIRISIIIPTFNRAEYLFRLIRQITRQSFPSDQYEIIIIDSESTDNTADICNSAIKKYPHHNIRYILESTPGLLSKRHRGAIEANGDILSFVDDDIIPFTTWLSAIAESFEDSTVQLTGGKSLPRYETEPPSWLSSLWSETPYGGQSCDYLSLLDLGDQQREIHPNFIWGLNLSIRKKTLFDEGGFHPDLYPKQLQRYQGDGETGLTQSCFNKKIMARYNPDAGIYHCIPKQRLTMQYFEERMYYQGVCDSYSTIRASISRTKRQSDNTKISGAFLSPIRKVQNVLAMARWLKKHRYDALQIMAVQQRMKRGYKNGYLFHQQEVKNDPELLQWVLKEHYWDYRLPHHQ